MNRILKVMLCAGSEVQIEKLKRAIDLMDGVEIVTEGQENGDSELKDLVREIQDFLYKHENPNDFDCPLRALRDELTKEIGEEYAVKQAWNPRNSLVRKEMIPAPVEPAEQPELPDIGVWVQEGESRGELAEAIRTFHTVKSVEEKEENEVNT